MHTAFMQIKRVRIETDFPTFIALHFLFISVLMSGALVIPHILYTTKLSLANIAHGRIVSMLSLDMLTQFRWSGKSF